MSGWGNSQSSKWLVSFRNLNNQTHEETWSTSSSMRLDRTISPFRAAGSRLARDRAERLGRAAIKESASSSGQ
jgi:hypothetical protein